MSDYRVDSKAIELLKSFVKDKLGGDIKNLRTFNLASLENDSKYGSTYHTRAPIVKAIMVVAFSDVWPDLSLYHIDHGPYECDTIQTFQNLFGMNMCDQYFKGMQKFEPSAFAVRRPYVLLPALSSSSAS